VNRKFLALAVAVLTGLIFFSACTKLDTTDIGNDLIPAVDNVNTFEAVLDVTTDNFFYDDTTRISASSLHAIGLIKDDPEFGRTNGEAYFSLVPSVFNTHPFVNRDSIIAVDSIVLSLPFTTIYGDSNSMEQFEVVEIDPASGFTDSVYQIKNPPFTTIPTVLGSKQVILNTLNDSLMYVNYSGLTATVYDTVRTANVLRIRLDPSWANKFLAYDTSVEYKNDSSFRSNFRGLAVRVNEGASPAANALAYFSLQGTTAASLTFYSRIKKDGQVDTIAPAFSFTGRRWANLVTRDPQHNYLTTLNNGSPIDNTVYIQSSPGSVATVKIAALDTLSNRVIHRAELICEELPSTLNNIYVAPPILFIDQVNEAGDSTFTIRNDFVPTGQGTGYDVNTLEGIHKDSKYKFNISRYVQSIVTKKLRSRTLRIYAPYATWPFLEDANGHSSTLPFFLFINSPIGAYRVVLGGGNHPTNKMRLRIIYSKI
jgi:hypothetical protein